MRKTQEKVVNKEKEEQEEKEESCQCVAYFRVMAKVIALFYAKWCSLSNISGIIK